MSKEKKTYNNLHDLYKDMGLLDECEENKKEEKPMIEEHFKDLVSWDHKRKTLEDFENIETHNNETYSKLTTGKAFKKFIKDNKLNEVETSNTNRVLFGAKIDLLLEFKPVDGKNITDTRRFPDIHHFNISVDGYIVSNKITSTIIFTDFYRNEIFRIDTSSSADTVVPVYAGMKVSIFSFLIDNKYSNNSSKILYIPAIRYTANTATGDPAMDFIKEI